MNALTLKPLIPRIHQMVTIISQPPQIVQIFDQFRNTVTIRMDITMVTTVTTYDGPRPPAGAGRPTLTTETCHPPPTPSRPPGPRPRPT